MSAEDDLSYLAAGGKLSAPENASARYRGEVMRLMAVLIDLLMAGASGFADCINLAPGLKERITAARIVLEKFGHAEKILALMDQFGANTAQYVSAHPWAARRDRSVDLSTRRIEGDMRLNVFHYPIYGWVDAVTLNFLMGRATVIQLDEFTRGPTRRSPPRRRRSCRRRRVMPSSARRGCTRCSPAGTTGRTRRPR